MRAGFAKFDITPRIGVSLYGFGPYLNRNSTAVRDRLEARAGVFELDGKRCVIIGCDLCSLQAHTCDTIRTLIAQSIPGLEKSDILISASHTHSGPATVDSDYGWGVPDAPYMKTLPYRIAQSAICAFETMEEVSVSSALVPCRHIGLNRVYDKDAPPLEEVLKDDWEPEKPELTDTQCRVIRFDATDGLLKGFMVYFGCHPVVCSASGHYIHGDFPAVAIHNLMREFPGSTGIFLQGAEGDVNSGCVHKGEKESLLALDVFAGRFANAIREGLQKAEKLEINAIASISKTFSFKKKQVFTRKKLKEMRKVQSALIQRPDADDTSWAVRMAAVYLRGIDAAEKTLGADSVPDEKAELNIIRMGELEFMGTPFEVMQAIKNDIHAGASAKYPMLMSLANGVHGYAPDNDSLRGCDDITSEKGNYESVKTPLIAGRLPYADIHNELVRFMAELEKTLETREHGQ